MANAMTDYASIGRAVDQIHRDFCQARPEPHSSGMLRDMLGASFTGIQAMPGGSLYKFDYLVHAGFDFKPWVHRKVCELSRNARWDVTGTDHSAASGIYRFDIFERLPERGPSGELRAYFDHIGVRHALMSSCLSDHGWQYVMFAGRSPGQDPFSEADRDRLRAMLPHFRCALRSRTRLIVAQGLAETCASGLDRLGIGVIALDGKGQTSFMNPVAERFLARRDGLVDQPRFGAAAPAANQTLQSLLRATARDDWSPGGRALGIPRLSGDPGYELIVDALPCPLGIARDGGVIIYLRDRLATAESAIDPDMLQELFGFTQMEAVVASSAASGRSTSEIAEHLGIQYNTVRAHLRAIYAKRGWSNRSELVQMVLSSPALMAASGAAPRRAGPLLS